MNYGYCQLCDEECDTQACMNKRNVCVHLCGPCRVKHGYQHDAHGILDANGNLKEGESTAERNAKHRREMGEFD